MKLLLDTHTFIWFVEDDEKLPSSTKNQIEDIDNEILVSIVSLWEIAIKTSLGKLEISNDIPSMIKKIEMNGFTILPIFPEHTVCVSTLPFHHRDPFDRMLISQSITENIRIISKDGVFGEYDIDCFW
jgi:PIN domain nuclease of toxin-antitoxin system